MDSLSPRALRPLECDVKPRSAGEPRYTGQMLLVLAAAALAQDPSALARPPSALVTRGDTVFALFAGHVVRSRDAGATWSAVDPLSAGLVVPVDAIAVAGDTLVATTGAGFLWSGDDGATWSAVAPVPRRADDEGWSDLAVVGDTVLASTTAGELARSTDRGRTWAAAGEGKLASLAAVGGRFVAVGPGEPMASADGLSWSLADHMPPAAADGAVRVATRAVSEGVELVRSVDGGATWKAIDRADRAYKGVVARGASVLVVDAADRVRLGLDGGKKWVEVAAPGGSGWDFPDGAGVEVPVAFSGDHALVPVPGGIVRVPLDPRRAASRVAIAVPLAGRAAARAPVPDGALTLQVAPLGGAVVLPASWGLAPGGDGSRARLRRGWAYGPPLAVEVWRAHGTQCADAPRPSADRLGVGAVAAPGGVPAEWTAALALRDASGPGPVTWDLCLDAPAGAVRVALQSDDPAAEPDAAQLLGQLAVLGRQATAPDDITGLLGALAAEAGDEEGEAEEEEEDEDGGGVPIAGFTAVGIEGAASWPRGAQQVSEVFLLSARSTQHPYGSDWVSAGMDLGLGFSVGGGGFAYELGLRLGPGHWIGKHVAVGVHSGFGFDGVTTRTPFALQSPLGATAQLHLGRKLSVLMLGQGTWTYATKRPGQDWPLGFDEWRASLDLSFAERRPANSDDAPSGLVLGVTWRRFHDGDLWGIHVGTGNAEDPN